MSYFTLVPIFEIDLVKKKLSVYLSEGVLLYLANFNFCQAGNQPHIHDGDQQPGSR